MLCRCYGQRGLDGPFPRCSRPGSIGSCASGAREPDAARKGETPAVSTVLGRNQRSLQRGSVWRPTTGEAWISRKWLTIAVSSTDALAADQARRPGHAQHPRAALNPPVRHSSSSVTTAASSASTSFSQSTTKPLRRRSARRHRRQASEVSRSGTGTTSSPCRSRCRAEVGPFTSFGPRVRRKKRLLTWNRECTKRVLDQMGTGQPWARARF